MNQKELKSWLSRRRESRVLKRIREHLIHVNSCIDKAQDFFDFWVKKDEKSAERMFEIIHQEEKTADSIEAEIVQLLSEGETPDYVRTDLLNFIRMADKSAGGVKRGTDNLLLIIKHDYSESILNIIREIFNKVAAEADQFFAAFDQMFKLSEEELKNKVNSVADLESEIDQLYKKMKYEISYNTENMPAGALIILDHAIRDIEESSDLLEDCADLIKSIVIL